MKSEMEEKRRETEQDMERETIKQTEGKTIDRASDTEIYIET